jgi:hypothetical protein
MRCSNADPSSLGIDEFLSLLLWSLSVPMVTQFIEGVFFVFKQVLFVVFVARLLFAALWNMKNVTLIHT